MAEPQHKKLGVDEPTRAETNSPADEAQAGTKIGRKAWEFWDYPPEFCYRLPEITLNSRSLFELRRRTKTRHSRPSPPVSSSADILSDTTTRPQDLARLARHGGPDLCSLRGYPEPALRPATMGAIRSSRSPKTNFTVPSSPILTADLPTLVTGKTKKSTKKDRRSSPYNRDFKAHLQQHCVHPIYSSQKPDLGEVRAALELRRGSVSPSKFSEGAFEAFEEADARAENEAEVLAHVIPTILGPAHSRRFCARNTVLRNLEPLTDGTITFSQPDFFGGTNPEKLAVPVRDELAGHSMPSTKLDVPMAPNVFLTVKGPHGTSMTAINQTRYDGALGSRAMHSLRNYGVGEPAYDSKPDAFSFTFSNGLLRGYAHHMTAPTADGGRPEYRMKIMGGWALTNSRATCVEGISAFRNTLDLAEATRENLIRAANARASQPKTTVAGQGRTPAKMQPTEDSADESAPSPLLHTTQMQHEEDSTGELALVPPRHLREGDESRDPPAVDPPTRLTSIWF
ncbi:hypothetical protein HJFPF1_05192 [Paramyrothecium foliicola]|nr:hypothetical protein HJFPF1_05192 [Paramyrothecium foliicola]